MVEVFEPTIGGPQDHHRVELFGYYGLDWIGANMRCRKIEKNGIVNLNRPRHDYVPKADVHLDGDACSINDRMGLDANAAIFEIFSDGAAVSPSMSKTTPSSGTAVEQIALKVGSWHLGPRLPLQITGNLICVGTAGASQPPWLLQVVIVLSSMVASLGIGCFAACSFESELKHIFAVLKA